MWRDGKSTSLINLTRVNLQWRDQTLLLESSPGLLFNYAPNTYVYASLHIIVAKGCGKGNTKSGIVSLL
jgi:hypothetical protein